MFYSSVLYYPYVGVMDSPWLKHALLFWDRIYVLMPRNVDLEKGIEKRIEKDFPRHSTSIDIRKETTLSRLPEYAYEFAVTFNKYMMEEGLLVPIDISSDSSAVSRATKKMIELLETRRLGKWGLDQTGKKHLPVTHVLREKLPADLSDMFELWESTNPGFIDRISYDISHRESVKLPTELVGSYMSLLAIEVAKDHRLAVGTDDIDYENSMFNILGLQRSSEKEKEVKKGTAPATGCLVHLLMQTFNVEDASIDEIAEFRNKHINELSSFRGKVGELFSDIPEDASQTALEHYFRDCWKNAIEPQMNNLRRSLESKKRVTAISLLKTAAFCSPASLFSLAIPGPLGMAISTAAGALPIVVEAIKERADMKEMVRNNPFSYVLKVQSMFPSMISDSSPHWERLGYRLPI